MAALKFLNLLTISTLAILACSFTASPVNALTGSDHHNVGRSPIRGHDSIAKRKRDTSSKRCKPRSASSTEASTTAPAPETTSQAAVTTTKAAASTTKAAAATTAKPHTTSSSSYAVATTSAASSGSSSSSNGSGKGGLAWPNGNQSYLKNFKTSKVNYLYTWSPELPDNCWSLGFNCIPMLWGENQISDFSTKVVKGYANIALGFNEPNESGQSNMTPDRGAQLWKQYLAPLRSQGYQLGSPATSSNPNGFTWVQNFVSACNGGCEFDFVALHWYDVKAADFIAYVEKWHNGFNKPVMVTEYACQNFNGGAQCSKDDIFSFTSTVNSWMDSTDYVLAYFPFGVMGDMQGVNDLDRLMTSSGSPTDLGYLFINP